MTIELHDENAHYLMAPQDIDDHIARDHSGSNLLVGRWTDNEITINEAAAWLDAQGIYHVDYDRDTLVNMYVHEVLHRNAERGIVL